MAGEIRASKLGRGLIAAIRANDHDKFDFSDYSIERGAEAVIKKLEKHGISIEYRGYGDNKFSFRDGFCGIGFKYGMLDLGMIDGTCYIKISENYIRRCVEEDEIDFFKELAVRFWNRATRIEKCTKARRNRNHEVYKQLKEEKRKAYFESLRG